MPLREELQDQGNWLFRYRSYLPLVILPLVLIAVYEGNSVYKYGLNVEIYKWFCVFVSFIGLFTRAATIGFVPKGTSGRNTQRQVAERVNTTGIYSIVRHPLYLGNFFMMLGIIMFAQSYWLVLFFIPLYLLYYERIMYAEESFLIEKYGDQYTDWARKTPLFLPGFSKWTKPDMPFSLRTVLRREYSGFFGMIASFCIIELFEFLLYSRNIEDEYSWIIFFFAGMLTYLTLRTLKKKTKVLNVEGRC